MKHTRQLILLVLVSLFPAIVIAADGTTMRPPAMPLVVHDPYFSIWSPSNQLTDSWPQHWTGATHALCGMVRIDGTTYRVMGIEPKDAPAMKQIGLNVLPTRTIYDFEAVGVHVRLTFTTPMLPRDLDLVARPVTYLACEARATDGRPHKVSFYCDAAAEIVVDKPNQPAVWSRPNVPGLNVLKLASKDQPVLAKAGDDLRIDWGSFYLAAPADQAATMLLADHQKARSAFAKEGRLPTGDDSRMPRAANDAFPVAACAIDLGEVAGKAVSRHVLLAYDDEYSIEYLGVKLRPYWRRNGMDAAGLLQTAAKQYGDLTKQCEAFDNELMADSTRAGGDGYANLCALSYRQAIAGHKLAVLPDGRPVLFAKECFSNGCIATVDVIYPAAPIFMLFSNELLKASMTPVLDYAAMPRWKFPFAPHDLGTYPKANGQVYGGGEKTEADQMPVEESGNLLIIAAVICRLDGNTVYAEKYWPLFERWACYLKQKGLDPDNQLCTDDFAGHLAHNTNLSIKAIMALGAYAQMCAMAGKKDAAAEYHCLAESFAKQWVKMADDCDHYRLTFDHAGTWSQKYNLVWDKLLGLNLFPAEVAAKEIAYYKTKLGRYGLPLDSRKAYTKTDWEVWTATLATSRTNFEALMKPVYDFVSATPQRVPLTDWYWTTDAKMESFQARPVIGGVFIKMLDDPAIWKKWADPFKPIFNGKDLTGWDGEPGYWSVEDGAITGLTTAEKPLNHATYLFWRDEKPADFELRAQFRFVSADGNSGINFRSQELPKGDVKGYQADMETGPTYTGILYECNGREIMTQRGLKLVIAEDGRREVTPIAPAVDWSKVIKKQDWNEYVILAHGPEIILKINGETTSHVIDRERGKAASNGLITLQLHPGPPMKVQFKNLRISKLP